MGFKRKRSCSNASPTSSVSSFTAISSRASQSPTPSRVALMTTGCPISALPFTGWGSNYSRLSSSDLNSRTRKRFRDNRPAEQNVHESTLNKLFAAQKQHPDASPIPSQMHYPSRRNDTTQRSTLHAFWQLPKAIVPPTPFVTYASQPVRSHQSSCDECDKTLDLGDAMDVDAQDLGADDAFLCRSCQKRVCDTCAVAGDERHCLECTTGRGILREHVLSI